MQKITKNIYFYFSFSVLEVLMGRPLRVVTHSKVVFLPGKGKDKTSRKKKRNPKRVLLESIVKSFLIELKTKNQLPEPK